MKGYLKIYNKDTGRWETHLECPRCAAAEELAKNLTNMCAIVQRDVVAGYLTTHMREAIRESLAALAKWREGK